MAILVTGAAGFIGHYTVKALLDRGEQVIGVDSLNDYYDPALKRARLDNIGENKAFTFVEGDIADGALAALPVTPTGIIHLAAQAGVRYSIDNPRAYAKANLTGHTEVLELARALQVKCVYASSSSVYGGNTKTPFSEEDRTDDPVSFYGATKKSDELLSQSYARLYGLPLVGLRFFTVYGPMGRPDMAYWMFTDKILKGEPIRIFNQGKMGRDFTYVDDIVTGVLAAYDRPLAVPDGMPTHRIYNLGNDNPEELMTLVTTIEDKLGLDAEKIFEPMQQGDVERTWADISRARSELGYDPKTGLEEGLDRFVHWFRDFYNR
ncbi:NAD-dependent epimerase/dehydratase family protein [Parvularcula sp. LCG005]|uniref:NAD-dependent epimerase/dehydratase family protein n=1 Tax=Parvularcula sp. LCG005 TaxID=3078805 RepID=UPI002941EB9F|nr:NAD-dependent epimerase/dehydratase family protein [Parvularcula sp. LCG005]WOI53091.1 GDP-mannose 4,6-dehydratase [Parvularcula sp. LCG005]